MFFGKTYRWSQRSCRMVSSWRSISCLKIWQMARSVRIQWSRRPLQLLIGKIYEISTILLLGSRLHNSWVDYHDSGSILKCIDPHVGQSYVQQWSRCLIERMNAKAKELGWPTRSPGITRSGGGHLHLARLLSGKQLSKWCGQPDNCCSWFRILVYHLSNQYPDILNYTNQAQVTVKKGFHMRNLWYLQLFIARASMPWKVDGWKLVQAPRELSTIFTIDHQTGNQRLIAVIMGVDWADQDGNTAIRLAMPWSKKPIKILP